MAKNKQIAFIGGGNMAEAMIKGMLDAGFSPTNIHVIELSAERRDWLEKNLQVSTTDNFSNARTYEAIVLAVKPQQLKAVAQSLVTFIHHQLLISIAAGIRLQDLSRWLGGYSKIIRAMPNTPAQIGQGMTGFFAPESVSKSEIEIAETILGCAGHTLQVNSEEKIDAITAISGSGPAYVFYMMEALQAAAESLGFNAEEAAMLSKQTFRGASNLAQQSEATLETLRKQVTSKGGTTEQAILSFERDNLKAIIQQAANAAKARAKTLADELGNTDD